jgi:hypothetical protein
MLAARLVFGFSYGEATRDPIVLDEAGEAFCLGVRALREALRMQRFDACVDHHSELFFEEVIIFS